MATRQLRTTMAILVGGLTLAVTVAGCSGGAKTAATTSTPAVSPTVSAAVSSASGSASGTTTAAGFAKYTACLQSHGIVVPSFSPRARFSGSGLPRPGGSFSRPPGATGSRPPGGFGGFGGPDASANPSASAALAACASLRPAGGGFGGGRLGGGAISAATFAAFKSCMSDNGVPITSTDAQAAIRALDRNDAKTVAALKVCQPILGQIARSPVASASPSS